jgi:fluoride exporter
MTNILLVMAGGSIGALSRYGVSLLAVKLCGSRFPWGTLAVNLAGCFLIGVAYALAERGSTWMTPSVRVFFVTGYLGALTTFSTYALETTRAAGAEDHVSALLNMAANNLLGLALVLLGAWVARAR